MSEYSAEELLRLSQFVKDMQSILGGSRDDNDDDEARAWDDYEKASSALAAYAKRIKADKRAVPHVTERLVQVAENARVFVLNDAPKRPRMGEQELRHIAMRSALLAVWPNRPAQAAQSVDIEAIREVIESHINEAKKLRHDPESQDYLYEQADMLTAALQEKGNG